MPLERAAEAPVSYVEWLAIQTYAAPMSHVQPEFLPGVPAPYVLERLAKAGGHEVTSGKLMSPESSAALAVNTFGWFRDRPERLPLFAIMRTDVGSPTVVELEYCARFPWSGGRHPCLDAWVETSDAVIGIESKRFEPYRGQKQGSLSPAYDRPVWHDRMGPFEAMRDRLRFPGKHFRFLDAVQLVKHAFGLVTQGRRQNKKPHLVYLFAEPKEYAGRPIAEADRRAHREEITRFAAEVHGAEVGFRAISYKEWLAVVVFRKSAPPPVHRVRFSFAGPIESPTTEALVPLDVLRHSRKWTQFPARTNFENTDEPTLGDLFFIKRGLATGSNSFFIMDSEQVSEWNIPRQFLKPILPSPRHVTIDVIDAHPNGDPAVSPRHYLLDCSEPEETIEKRWPRFYEYLQKGREEKIAASYLASHRAPWYSQEKRPPAPFLCTYMGRARNGKHPFRFIWNRSQATAHNVYLMLYPKSRLQEALNNDPGLAAKVFEALQTVTPGQFISEGRVYGGGLHKVEPKELAQIPARAILESVEGHFHIERQEKLFA